jgi:AAA family ATP:ADP antiporter
MCVSREWKENKDFRKETDMKMLLDGMLRTLRQKDYPQAQKLFFKINIARVVGEANNPELYSYLQILLNDESLEVLQAAITSAGQTQAKEFAPILITHLTTKHLRKIAREALAEYGEGIIGLLAKHLEDASEDKKKRMAIPKVLALIGSQKSVNICTKNLEQRDLLIRYEIIKTLNKLRANFPELKFDKQPIHARIMEEIEQYYRILTLLYRQKNSISAVNATESSNYDPGRLIKARKLLTIALEENLDSNLERIFRLLGLKYPPKDMHNAYLGVKSNKADFRANSVEFLDNILESKLKKILIPIVESTSPEFLLAKTKELFGFSKPTESESINLILQSNDNWLKICTLHLISELNYDEPIDSAVKLLDDPDLIVNETAKYYLKKMGISN